ncbi:hypothetical protein E2C01_090942 [Portunus trituberculatus]|uniref:Uncharacterized protein n=1 Tax=Portunus trituberculatus TaxID=210409 RepID=A0A5B7JRP7_PORTR|nr:hypothetical protein [Portunus trituberculatus]
MAGVVVYILFLSYFEENQGNYIETTLHIVIPRTWGHKRSVLLSMVRSDGDGLIGWRVVIGDDDDDMVVYL